MHMHLIMFVYLYWKQSVIIYIFLFFFCFFGLNIFYQLKYIVVRTAVVLISVMAAANECDSGSGGGLPLFPVVEVDVDALRHVIDVRSVPDDVDIELTRKVASLLRGRLDRKLWLLAILLASRLVYVVMCRLQSPLFRLWLLQQDSRRRQKPVRNLDDIKL